YIPKENRGKAFGLIGSIVAMGEGVGPAIGGMIAHYIHWSYLLLIPMITIITVPFLMKLLKKEVRIKGHFDIKGIILMYVGIVFFMVYANASSIHFVVVRVLAVIIVETPVTTVVSAHAASGVEELLWSVGGVVCRGLIFGTVAAVDAMVPDTMEDIRPLSS